MAVQNKVIPTKIILKSPDGSTVEKDYGSISDPVLAAELEAFRTNPYINIKGSIVKKVP